MSNPLRSKHGCWTCRLRKKKCDERQPGCAVCELLCITCYGFGDKPEWMDGGEKERVVANGIKEIVKHTSRRKVSSQATKQVAPVINIAPKPAITSVEIDLTASESIKLTAIKDQTGHSTNSSSADNGKHLSSESLFSVPAEESVLLMHYLDHVFSLQFPVYKPSIVDGGRGWLLGVLLRSKPLHHVSLALSICHYRRAYHQYGNQIDIDLAIQQEKHLGICLNDFTQLIGGPCPKDALDVMFAILQLVFFELFTGHNSVWQAHLRAVSNMFQKGYEYEQKNGSRFRRDKISQISTHDGPLVPKDDPIIHAPANIQELSQYRFVTSVILWLDIASSVTSGNRPHLMHCHDDFLACDSQIALDSVMGCRNWVLLQIGRIARLHSDITQALKDSEFDCTVFKQFAEDIEMDIQHGVIREAFCGLSILDHEFSIPITITSDPTRHITYLFACMATIYLHLVIQGFENLDVIEPQLSAAMRVLQSLSPTHLLPSLVLPLFIIGSVAREGDKQFFRSVFSSLQILDSSFKHRETFLSNLEEIWERRRQPLLFVWKNCLDSIGDLLLI